jgi:predicted amidohydrolase
MRVAAVQMSAVVGDVDANLEICERLAGDAAAQGAEAIVLPEFFSTGIGFVPELIDCALPPEGAATALLCGLARRHGAMVGGSFLCRDTDGEVRNAFVLALPDGTIAGRHDKDLPTMWENCFYVGGSDDGLIDAGELSVGIAMCWELMRSQTVLRLCGQVDLVLAGSGWWSVGRLLPPGALLDAIERRNTATAWRAAEQFAAFVGAPVVHAAQAGPLRCAMPWWPRAYDGHFVGGAVVCDADGAVLARRRREDGDGAAIADIEPRRVARARACPDRFWLHRRGLLAAAVWSYQRVHGRRWYATHAAGATADDLDDVARGALAHRALAIRGHMT